MLKLVKKIDDILVKRWLSLNVNAGKTPCTHEGSTEK